MPEWLLRKDNYIPPKEKDAFIDKSILSIFNVISKLKPNMEGKVNRLMVNPALKLLTAFAIVMFVSLSHSSYYVLSAGVFVLLILSILDSRDIAYVIKMSLAAAFFTGIVLIPSFIMGNRHNSIMIIMKVIVSVAAVNIASCTMKWSEAAGALKLFFVPDIFIFVFEITMKYIIIFGEFSLNMLYALKLKSVGKNKKKTASLSGIMGTMFIKSKETADEMYSAMECRGFTGEYKRPVNIKLGAADMICIIIDVALIGAYFYIGRY